MNEAPRTSPGDELVDQWDGRDYLGRLHLIMENENHFWMMRLITRSEIARVHQMHESAREYVAAREDQPFFTSLNIKKTLAEQITKRHRDKLKAALWAVFK